MTTGFHNSNARQLLSLGAYTNGFEFFNTNGCVTACIAGFTKIGAICGNFSAVAQHRYITGSRGNLSLGDTGLGNRDIAGGSLAGGGSLTAGDDGVGKGGVIDDDGTTHHGIVTDSGAGALGDKFNLVILGAGKCGTGNLDIALEAGNIGAGDIGSRNAEVLTTLDGGVGEAACIHDDIALVVGNSGAGDGGICTAHFHTVELIGIGAGDGAALDAAGDGHLAGEIGEIGIRNLAADGEVRTTLHCSIDGVALGIGAAAQGAINRDSTGHAGDIGAGNSGIHAYGHICCAGDGAVGHRGAACHGYITLVVGDGGAGDGGICTAHFHAVELIGIGAGDGAALDAAGDGHLAGEIGEIGIRNLAADGEVRTTLHCSIDGVALGIGAAAQGAINRDSTGHAGDIGAGNSGIHAYGHICCAGDGAVGHRGATCHGYIALVVGDGGAGDGGICAAHFDAVNLIGIGAGDGAALDAAAHSHLAGHIGKRGVGNTLTLSHGNGACTLHGGISHGDFAVAGHAEGAIAGDIERGTGDIHHLVCTSFDIHIATNGSSHTADDGLIIAVDTGIAADDVQVITHVDGDAVVICLVNDGGIVGKIQAAAGVDGSAIGDIRIGKGHIASHGRNSTSTSHCTLVERHIAAGRGNSAGHCNRTRAVGIGRDIIRSGK